MSNPASTPTGFEAIYSSSIMFIKQTLQLWTLLSTSQLFSILKIISWKKHAILGCSKWGFILHQCTCKKTWFHTLYIVTMLWKVHVPCIGHLSSVFSFIMIGKTILMYSFQFYRLPMIVTRKFLRTYGTYRKNVWQE